MVDATHVNVGGSWEEVPSASVNVGGVWRQVVEIWVNVAGVWELAFQGLALAKSGNASAGTGVTTTNSVTVTPSDGVGPYTYMWFRASSSNNQESVSSPTNQTVTWSVPGPAPFTTATWNCVVTDSLGDQAAVSVQVTFAGA